MTPKEEYEARKAAKRQQREEALRRDDDDRGVLLDLMETLDRIAEAFERIAFALEGRANV